VICITDKCDIASAFQIKGSEEPAKATANNNNPRSFLFHVFDAPRFSKW
jgi:hypothetical protein